jgi:hypothetical protein
MSILSAASIHVDEEFQRNRTSTIATLSRARYANVARNFQEAHDHLSAVPAEGAALAEHTRTRL